MKLLTALKQQAIPPVPPRPDPVPPAPGPGPEPNPIDPQPPIPSRPSNTHFGMTTTLDNTRVIKSLGSLMDEVINHLMQVNGAKVEIRLLVDATMPDGTPVPTVRTVTENCRTLHVEDFGFND